jgi:hypothetical protein
MRRLSHRGPCGRLPGGVRAQRPRRTSHARRERLSRPTRTDDYLQQHHPDFLQRRSGRRQRPGRGVDVLSFGNNTGFQCSPVILDDFSFTNDTGADLTLRLWLQDNSCSFIYFADGSHAKIGNTRAAMNDASLNNESPSCEFREARNMPKGKRANLTVSVSIE